MKIKRINKILLKKYNYVWKRIRDKIKEVSSDKYDYKKNYIKIKFNSNDKQTIKLSFSDYNY